LLDEPIFLSSLPALLSSGVWQLSCDNRDQQPRKAERAAFVVAAKWKSMHKVVLTFDDGPDPENTPRILDVLAREDVPAVFFIVGERLSCPGALDIVRRAASAGHLIGNHTFSHPKLTELPPEDIRTQILQTHDLIAEFEPKRKLFRPPYGASNKIVINIAKSLNYKTVLWNVSSEDWKAENRPGKWVDIAIEQIRVPHLAICLCHDLGRTADHLPQLLERVKQLQNRKFVRYDRRRDLRWLVERAHQRARDWLNSPNSADLKE
jgi:peptidoglycan/xylan/chitin deacetylase (PgdA/CDA1 family)